MTRNQGVPDRQPPGKFSHPRRRDVSVPRSANSANPVENPNSAYRGIEPNPGSDQTRQSGQPLRPYLRSRTGQGAASQQIMEPEATVQASPQTEAAPFRQRFAWFGWLSSWKFWLIATPLIFTGSGVIAVVLLLKIPGMPNCPAIFWPLASASLRFECARLAAGKQTPKDLLEAIKLLDSLPPDHAMRAEANRLVEEWSQDVLKLAEKDFNAGKLAEAIAAARQIPTKTSAYKLVEDRIKHWQSIWVKAEGIYKQAEKELRQQNWQQAFAHALRLREVENTYWQTVKFDELRENITTAREDGNKLGRAYRLADEGGLKNLQDAIKLAESIKPSSYIYEAAQKAIPKFGLKMINLAQATLEQRDLQGALAILDKIPEKANLKEAVRDFTVLATAQAQVWQNTIPALEDAISQLQRIAPDRPLYSRAQKLITRWQLEIEAISQLDKAKVLAQAGSVDDLTAGIAEASQVDKSNPRWAEVQRQIAQWHAQIQTIQDRPILDLADQAAAPGDMDSLKTAIAQANQIGKGRALYKEAQGKVQQWTAQIQEIQDQPILDQAREYANGGDLQSAVNLAQQIQSGRSLYSPAQADIRKWRDQLHAQAVQAQAQQTMQQAYALANSGSPSALANAIQLAGGVPASSPLKSDASNAVNEWSQQLLQAAQTQAAYDVPGAIAAAEKIPPRATTYTQAQQLIQSWKRLLGQ
ncbi:chromosome segregation ATPase [Kovacikia minuta CCNUW1]|uniref:chromosome segregation ATPase n=1 Tax=Kovacikia minuta TaxID=2931930 RepID=UPI001CCFA61B|nr:chromosome segregation ATPase [Kovacikia minuta]UBF29356.1 chromosome segregation ATPase [Kovacikia minuta CCNUW1]